MCADVQQSEPPAADHPTATEEKSLVKCSSLDLYYGFGEPADPVKARKCAYAEIDRGSTFALGGRAILTMIYANGKGVPRNYDIALKIACSINDAPGDAAGRVYELNRMKKSKVESRFDICSHSAGHDLYAQCAILSARFDKIDRDKQLHDMIASWNPADQKAFRSFWAEGENFSKVQASNAIDLGGTFESQEEVFWLNHIVDLLKQFESGDLPKHSAGEAKKAQEDEAAAYAKTQNGDKTQWGTVTRDSVKTSEDEWHRYVNAWIAFGKQKYPGVTEDGWKAWLYQERANMLTKLTG